MYAICRELWGLLTQEEKASLSYCWTLKLDGGQLRRGRSCLGGLCFAKDEHCIAFIDGTKIKITRHSTSRKSYHFETFLFL